MSTKTKNLSEEEQLKLRKKAKDELVRLEKAYSNRILREKINEFNNRFEVCEIVYKVILGSYQYAKTGQRQNRLLISMKQVPHALNYAGYDFDRDLLSHLFGSEEKVGIRTVKKLRDSLTHSANQNAINELIEREEELFGYMDHFLSKIRSFDGED